jgi:ring-1,2-phenylacetyl-CoA epoxidase subunit PaaB
MNRGQWPVYQVFERLAPDKPMRASGSVHAVDAETALENAWAVYGRRPNGVSFCVVPRSEIVTKPREEFAQIAPSSQGAADSRQTFCVFRRKGEKLLYEQGRSVVAANAGEAMTLAVSEAGDCFAIWVFPAASMTSSASVSADCPNTSQPHKWFRDHKSFPVFAMLREIRAEEAETNNA